MPAWSLDELKECRWVSSVGSDPLEWALNLYNLQGEAIRAKCSWEQDVGVIWEVGREASLCSREGQRGIKSNGARGHDWFMCSWGCFEELWGASWGGNGQWQVGPHQSLFACVVDLKCHEAGCWKFTLRMTSWWVKSDKENKQIQLVVVINLLFSLTGSLPGIFFPLHFREDFWWALASLWTQFC